MKTTKSKTAHTQAGSLSENDGVVSIAVSHEHAKYIPEIQACFKGIKISPENVSHIMRFSMGDLAMQITIFLSGAVAGGMVYDVLKIGVKNLRKKFKGAHIAVRDKENIIYSIKPDGSVFVCVVPDREKEFEHIKTIDDLVVHLQKKLTSQKAGSLPEGWEVAKLDDFCEIIMGQSPSGDDCNSRGEGLPLLNGPTEFGANYPLPIQFTTAPKKFAEKGDLLFCVRGSTTGRMNWAEQRYAIGRGIAALRHKEGVHLQPFLKGMIDYHLSRLLAGATGSTFPNVSRDQLSKIEIRLPSLPIQRRIAEILGSLDDRIELLRRTNRTLEEMAQALFRRWFVEFEFPAPDGKPYRSSGGRMVKSDASTGLSTGLGEIPEGWSAGRLDDICKINPSYQLKKGGTAKYLDMASLPTYGASITAEPIERPFGSGMKFINGDTLVARITPCLENGKTAFVDFLESGKVGWGSTEFIVLSPQIAGSYWLYSLARSESFRDFAIQRMSGSSGRQRVSGDVVGMYPIVAPGQDLFIEFEKVVTSLFEEISKNRRENINLATLRDSLLPRLMSGVLE